MIPPRGCAYVVMVHRQDAYTALNKLNRGAVKVNQKSIKVLLQVIENLTIDMLPNSDFPFCHNSGYSLMMSDFGHKSNCSH